MMSSYSPSRSASSRTAVSRWQSLSVSVLLPVGFLLTFLFFLNSQPAFALGESAEAAVETQMATEAVASQTGTIFYVTTTGSGTACTIANPCALQAAANLAQNADEVRVAAGTYTDISSQVLSIQRSTTFRGGFTPPNWDEPDPIANPTILDGEDNRRVIHIISGNPTIEGFIIQNGRITSNPGGAGILVNAGNPTFRFNHINNHQLNQPNGAIVSRAVMLPLLLTKFIATKFGNKLLEGIFVLGQATIEGNQIYQNTASNGGAIAGIGEPTSLNIYSNVIYQNNATNNLGGGAIVFDFNETTNTVNIWHNTFASNSAPASATGGGAMVLFVGTYSIRNNIVANNTAAGGSTGIFINGATLTGAYNNLFNNTSNDGGILTDPIAGDPLFVNAGAGDYHLQAASPNINAADLASTIVRDFDQEPRPFNGGFDVGADEYYPAGLTCFARLNSGGVDGDVYGDIQTVINLTAPGDIVKIAGTCTGTGPEIATLNSTITLRGGYDLLDWSEANRGQHAPTILDGQGTRRLLRLTAGNPTIDSLHLTGGTAANGSAILIQGGNPTIQNSIIYENTTTSGGAIGVETGATPTIQFTTITDNTGDGVNFSTNGSIHNSIAYNNSETQISGGVGHSFNLVSINPLFVDAANDDYRLTAASPALDFGDPAAVLDYDFEGNDRPRGQRPDVGADEANSYPSARFIPTSITQEVDRGTVENFNLTFESNGTLSGTWTLATSQVQGWDISHPALSGVINAEQSLPFGVVVTVPLAATPATPETILFTATSTINPNAVATAVLNLNIRPIREILFTPSYSSTLLPAEVITYTHTITNNGEFTDTIRVRIESDTFGWGELLRPDMSPAAGNSFTMTLPAGGVSLAYVRVTVADFAPAGLVNNTIARAESMADPTVVFATVTDRVTAKATVGTRYVSTIGDDLNNNCRVPSLPCQTVGHAVGQASVGDEVRVGAGEYATAEIPVNATISLRGGWNSSFTAQLEAPTILSAGGLDRIFNISGAATTPYLELLTLREGNRTTGGAILVRNGAQITINQLTFLENQATRGGALYVSAGTNVTLEKSAFRDNTASVDGGAIFVEGTLNSTNVLLEANEAVNGAAVYIRGTGSALFWHTTIHGNIASQRGGGLYLESGSLTIQNSSLTSNQAAVTSGAIHRVAGTLTADYNNVWNNSAPASNQPMGTNSVSVDPLYIDTFYRLSPVSPILDIGNPASPVEVDFEDNPRPSDQGFDMGWYELAGCLARRGGVVYFSLQEAIDAGGPALIQVSGVCRGVNTLDLGGGNIISQTAQIEDDIRIQGGWNSNFSNNTTTNPLPTFINPQGLGRGLYIHNGASPTIESIAIINGDATGLGGGPADEDAGGGVYIETGSPFFSQMGVYSSTAEFGGGIYNDLGSPTFALTGTHDTVLLNTADTLVSDLAYNTATRGGGFYNHNGVINLGNTFIRWNQAVDGAGAYFASGTGGTAANAVFAQNEASGNGGGLYNASNADLLHLTFYANSATGNGGGLYNTGNATVRSHIFQSNTAASGPAIFNTGGGTPTTGYNYYHDHTAPAVVGTAVGTGSVTSATPPGLIAPALGNFRLSGTAPAIDKADPASPITADFEADLRPSNLGFDMGADELAGCYARLNNTTIYGSPQAALANAADGDHIDVAGLCIGVQPRDAGAPLGVISQTLYIDKSVSFLGGWRDDFSQRDQVTVLDALGLGRVIYIAPGITPTITSFDLRGGDATVAGGNAHGGGIYINQANAVIETNELYDNTAANGGAIYVANASPTIAVGNHIYQNNATNGAAIYLNNVSVGVASVYNNFIYHNTASNQGGALHSAAGSNLLVHNTVVSNTAATGGGVYIAVGSPTVQSGIYQSNQATTGSGAFGQAGSTPVMGYNTFFDNTAAGTAAGGTGDRTADPNLSPEFTIDEDSFALNGGSPNSPIVVDFEGDPRPSDQYADMGADEIGNCFARIVGQPTIYYSAQVAVNAAVAGNTIEVDGWCIGANQRLVEGNPAFQALIIDKELTIDGGSWDVSGDGVDAILDARGEGRGLLVTVGISATVQNIKLIGGNAAVAGFNNGLGGGVYNAGTLTLNGIYVTENQAADGAAIYQASTGSLLLEQSTIEGNLASNRGGGLFLNGATAAVQNNFLFDNTAANGGGALYNAAGNAAIWHNTVISNTATNNNGGGFFLQGGTPTVGNNIVDSNIGTGIHATGSGLNIRFNNVVNNTPTNYGGNAADQQGNDFA
ncbi:MAG: right-handed parallel beta-helix repeat-containing protein [Chloroflexi bacterium]|nr:right-handed parallel beta-helix repeat-containing protein [Chloroflexota bacterium]